MKKSFLFVGLLAMGMLALQGCDEAGVGNGNGGGDNSGEPDLGGTMEQLAPDAQKTRLQEVGLEFVNEIKVGDHENLVDVTAYLAQDCTFDIDTVYINKVAALYEEEYTFDDGSGINPVEAVRSLMAVSLGAAKTGAKLSTRVATETWRQVLHAGLPDVYGGFTPNAEKELWVYDPKVDDRVEVSFTDDQEQTWVATLKGSKETTRVKLNTSFKYTEESNFVDGPDAGTTSTNKSDETHELVFDVPQKITFTVKCNNANVIDLTLNSSVAFEGGISLEEEATYQLYWKEWNSGYWDWVYDESTGDYVEVWVEEYEGYYDWDEWERNKYAWDFDVDYTNLNVDAALKVNAYEETFKTEVNKQGMTASASVKINGKQMLKAEGALKADIDAALKEGEATLTEEKDFDEIKVDALKEFSMFVDIMGKVQVVGKCDKFDDLFEAWVDLEEAEDEKDFAKYERNVKQANKAYSITIHYDNTETVQAKVEFEAYERIPEWDTSYSDYDPLPVIVFTVDESRHNFEDYFTESSFSDLVEAASDLYEDFENMLDDYFEKEYDAVTPDYDGGYYE